MDSPSAWRGPSAAEEQARQRRADKRRQRHLHARLVLAAVFGFSVPEQVRRDAVSSKANQCGRVHLGPICVNGGSRRQPVCDACGKDVTQAEREQVQRIWDAVHKMLDRFKPKPKKEKR